MLVKMYLVAYFRYCDFTGCEMILLQKLLIIFLDNLPCAGVRDPIREGILPEFLCLLLFFRQVDLAWRWLKENDWAKVLVRTVQCLFELMPRKRRLPFSRAASPRRGLHRWSMIQTRRSLTTTGEQIALTKWKTLVMSWTGQMRWASSVTFSH